MGILAHLPALSHPGSEGVSSDVLSHRGLRPLLCRKCLLCHQPEAMNDISDCLDRLATGVEVDLLELMGGERWVSEGIMRGF